MPKEHHARVPHVAPTRLEPQIQRILSENREISFRGVRRRLEESMKLPVGALDGVRDELNHLITKHLGMEADPSAASCASPMSPRASPSPVTPDSTLSSTASLSPPPSLSPTSTCPRWVKDSDRKTCPLCNAKFSLINRRHHCRLCGEVVCHACSPHKQLVASPFFFAAEREPVRICNLCYEKVVGPGKQAQDTDEKQQQEGVVQDAGGKDGAAMGGERAAASASASAGAAGGGGGGGQAAATMWFLTGEWTPDDARSRTTLEPLMKALGVPWAARKIVGRMKFMCELKHTSKVLTVTDTSTMGVKTQSFMLDGVTREVTNDKGQSVETRAWETMDEGSDKGSVSIETQIPLRDGTMGVMLDKRWMEDGGDTLHRIVTLSKRNGESLAVVDRLLVRTQSSCTPVPRLLGATGEEGASGSESTSALSRRRAKRRAKRLLKSGAQAKPNSKLTGRYSVVGHLFSASMLAIILGLSLSAYQDNPMTMQLQNAKGEVVTTLHWTTICACATFVLVIVIAQTCNK